MRFSKWTIPHALPCPWPLKPLSSARTTLGRLRNGQLELTIKHDLIRGVTREMIAWWFCHIDANMEYAGRIYPRYRVWHPYDHVCYKDITVAPDGSGSAGTRRHIVEAFGGNRRYFVNIIDYVSYLDESGILLSTEQAGITLGFAQSPLIPLGVEIGTLQHNFIAAPTGVRYESRMVIGHDSLFGRLFLNQTLLPWLVMSVPMGHAWLKHNVEEVGNFERFLPALYDRWLDGRAEPILAGSPKTATYSAIAQ